MAPIETVPIGVLLSGTVASITEGIVRVSLRYQAGFRFTSRPVCLGTRLRQRRRLLQTQSPHDRLTPRTWPSVQQQRLQLTMPRGTVLYAIEVITRPA